jgi:hypothetical protein
MSLAVSAVFVAFGAYVGSLAVSLADIERALDVSHGVFGLLMAVSVLCGGCASALVSVRAHRKGAGRTMRECLIAWAVILTAANVVPMSWAIALVLLVTTASAAAVDVVMNTVATHAVQGSPTRMLRIHSTYNLGAAAGAGVAGTLSVLDHDWRRAWLLMAIGALAMSFYDWSRNDSESAQEDDVPLHAAIRSLKTEGLLLVATAFVLGAVIEGGVDAWGPLYLRLDLEIGVGSGAGAVATGYLIGFVARIGMGVLSNRWSAKWCAILGAAIAGTGVLLLVAGPGKVLPCIGLAMAIGGITVNWPLLISYATEGGRNSALVTGGMSTAGYAGLVVSPAVLGGIAGFTTLRSSLSLLVLCALVVIILLVRLPNRHASPAET